MLFFNLMLLKEIINGRRNLALKNFVRLFIGVIFNPSKK